MQARAILFDIQSIQKYIFTNKRLKTNLGANYIVSHLFSNVLLDEVLKPEMFGKTFGINTIDTDSWQNGKRVAALPEGHCYVADIRGGSALLLFSMEGEDKRKDIVKFFTEKILVKYPGLKVGAALGELDLGEGADPEQDKEGFERGKKLFHESINKLYDKQKNNQFTIYPRVNVVNTGLTVPCEVNGEVANAFDTGSLFAGKGERFYSQEVVAKAKAAKLADNDLMEIYGDVMGDFVFPRELDHLGQKKEKENEIAVVHIDGNNMGKRFQECDTLEKRSLLSKNVGVKVQAAFRSLLKEIIDKYEIYKTFLNLEPDVLEKGETGKPKKKEVPILPFVLGGDDITFVCNARMALTFVQKFMGYLADKDIGGVELEFASCAGIAIVPTSYPFFRAYELAEQVCGVAKKASRKLESEPSSWIDFAILHGEQAPTIEQIRAQEYTGAMGDMHFGPYRFDGEESYHYHISKLISCADGIAEGKDTLPRNKWKELRDVLQRDKHDIKRFMTQLNHVKQKLPVIAGWERYHDDLWAIPEPIKKEKETDNINNVKKKTPYVDAIEIIDYIPPKEAR